VEWDGRNAKLLSLSTFLILSCAKYSRKEMECSTPKVNFEIESFLLDEASVTEVSWLQEIVFFV
jgi:hypothetical protein